MLRMILGFLACTLVCFALTDAVPGQPPKDQTKDQTKDKSKQPPPPPQPVPVPFNPANRRPPAPEYALAFMATVLVLLILCMPSRKGY